jgi:hypothetical protein
MAQIITVTRAIHAPAPIVLAADALCLSITGTFGDSGIIIEASDDGTNWAPVASTRDLGTEVWRRSGCFGIALRSGWQLRARAASPGDEDGTFAVRVAVA